MHYKKIYLFYEVEDTKTWYWENNYSHELFLNVLHHRGLTRFWACFWFLICLWFWICQSFGYTMVLNMLLVLNIPGFLIYKTPEYARVMQGSEYAWTIPEYVCLCLVCLNMLEYIGICMNVPTSVWMCFVLYFPISPFVFQYLFYLHTWLLIYTSTED